MDKSLFLVIVKWLDSLDIDQLIEVDEKTLKYLLEENFQGMDISILLKKIWKVRGK